MEPTKKRAAKAPRKGARASSRRSGAAEEEEEEEEDEDEEDEEDEEEEEVGVKLEWIAQPGDQLLKFRLSEDARSGCKAVRLTPLM